MFRQIGQSLLILCLAGLLLSGVSNASTLYLALPNQSAGSDMNAALEADVVTFATSVHLQQISFWSLQTSPADYAGSIAWSINSDSSGAPGASVASGSTTNTGTATGQFAANFTEYLYSWSVSVDLSAGSYWFVLHNGPTGSVPTTDFYWAWNSDSGNSQSQDIGPEVTSWNPNSATLALQLDGGTTGVPEPASALFAVTGLLGVVLYRFRKQNQG